LIARQRRLSILQVKIALRCADRVTAVSQELCDVLEKNYGFDAPLYIPNGVDAAQVRASATAAAGIDAGQFVFCGRITQQKRVGFLIEAFNECIKRGCTKKLYLVGDGAELNAIKDLIRSYGIGDRIIALGALPHAQTLGVISQSRCLVLCSEFEGLPQVALEAMALEKAIIAADVGGLRELVVHGESGYLYPPNRQDLLCDYIMELDGAGDRARSFGSRGLAKLTAQYNLDTVVKQYLDLYHALLADSGTVRQPAREDQRERELS
jgi:glycosyltransferase involved in cell wall biosynthesis